MNKAKNASVRSLGRSSQEQTPSPTTLLPQSEAMAVLTATGPITGPDDECKWIETKGYILSGECYSKLKLADILFSLAVDAKIPAEVKNAIAAVAFLIEDLAEEDFGASLSTKIISKIESAMTLINSEADNAKKFLSATTMQQAEATIVLQKAAQDFSSSADKLTQASTKATESIDKHQQQLSEGDWPRLSGSSPAVPTLRNPLSSNFLAITNRSQSTTQSSLSRQTDIRRDRPERCRTPHLAYFGRPEEAQGRAISLA
jgi:hypothetical protein